MKSYTPEELKVILTKHAMDLRGEAGGERANLYGANLRGANLERANFYGADLEGANLGGANLGGANLGGANLERANLYGANLRGANLERANFYGADLEGANLGGANLYGANLYGANLGGANLRGADLPAFQIPQEGPLVVWKKAFDSSTAGRVLVKLGIRGKRTATPVGRKCRAEAAKVLGVYSIEGKKLRDKTARSMHDTKFVYTVGKIVRVKNYDGDIRVECTRGIHFFQTFEEARDYNG